jgi:hypothetical protein
MIGRQGVGIYIRESLPYLPRPDLDSPALMSCTIQVNRPRKKPLVVASIYRHPQSDVSFFTHFESLLIKLDSSSTENMAIGDFNIDFNLKNDAHSKAARLDALINDYGYKQHTEAYTRITPVSKTIIDLCVSNIQSQVISGVAAVSVADHLLNYIVLASNHGTQQHTYVTSRNLNRVNFDELKRNLAYASWSVIESFDNIDDCWNARKSIFNSVIDVHCPLKTFRPRKRPNPWHRDELDEMKIARDQLHNRAILSGSDANWAKYRKARNKFTELTRKAREDYFKASLTGTTDSKRIWKYLKMLLPRSQSH